MDAENTILMIIIVNLYQRSGTQSRKPNGNCDKIKDCAECRCIILAQRYLTERFIFECAFSRIHFRVFERRHAVRG